LTQDEINFEEISIIFFSQKFWNYKKGKATFACVVVCLKGKDRNQIEEWTSQLSLIVATYCDAK